MLRLFLISSSRSLLKDNEHKQCSDWIGDDRVGMHNRKLAPILNCKPVTSVDRVTISLQHDCQFSVRFSTIAKAAARGPSPIGFKEIKLKLPVLADLVAF